ncbi:MAG: 7-carboxy-7-deazaguanine synthase QueE [Planctomycetota bacterium]|nr:7-carboxy-7-deazaguanine synthase QueE [Planctomycetota bacterium]
MSSAPVAAALSAPVLEVFASIQGEGRYVGEPQVFVRLRGCPLRCRWCDTPGSWSAQGREVRIDSRRGTRREPSLSTPFQVACWVAECEPGPPRTVSLTGGEPLAHPGFVLGLASFLGPRRLHLETAGAHPRALEKVLERVAHVSLDLKLPADLDAPVELESEPAEPVPRTRAEWAEVRAECLALVAERDACAKVIVAGNRAPEEFDELFESTAEHAPKLPVCIQPVTPVSGIPAPSIELVTHVAERARGLGLDVRIVPQVHRLLAIP